jgi:hypothetical protein
MEAFMRFATALLLTSIIFALACYKRDGNHAITSEMTRPASQARTAPADAYSGARSAGTKVARAKVEGEQGQLAGQVASFNAATSAQAVAQAFDRKIIRNADLEIELDSPEDAQRQITTIAEMNGGFVVTAESKLSDVRNAAAPSRFVTITVRVPSAQFNTTIEKIRGIGGRILQEKVSGQDVTEEYIDLEARIRTQKALEAQMIEILKRAGKISDALEVQNQIAAVRTEIERLEGRRRFLENQSALSTINISLHTPAPVVIATTAHGFWHEVKQAVGNGIDLASNITLGLIQFVIMLIPVLLLIVLPLSLIWRLLRAHINWPKKTVDNVDSSVNT